MHSTSETQSEYRKYSGRSRFPTSAVWKNCAGDVPVRTRVEVASAEIETRRMCEEAVDVNDLASRICPLASKAVLLVEEASNVGTPMPADIATTNGQSHLVRLPKTWGGRSWLRMGRGFAWL